MTREQARQVFGDLHFTGDLYRGYTLIQVARKEWRIPRVTYQRFDSRDEARKWVNERLTTWQNSPNLFD
jgi:hypothetical protein